MRRDTNTRAALRRCAASAKCESLQCGTCRQRRATCHAAPSNAPQSSASAHWTRRADAVQSTGPALCGARRVRRRPKKAKCTRRDDCNRAVARQFFSPCAAYVRPLRCPLAAEQHHSAPATLSAAQDAHSAWCAAVTARATRDPATARAAVARRPDTSHRALWRVRATSLWPLACPWHSARTNATTPRASARWPDTRGTTCAPRHETSLWQQLLQYDIAHRVSKPELESTLRR